jgi:gamma-glutamyltranspeptidase / glutathione hydrolase
MKTLVAALVISLCSMVAAQQFSSVPGQGRSMVVTKLGIVATPQFLASQAGAHILEQGGNAVDAAIAANAVMGVVQPYVNGMGGDLFAIYYDAKTGKLYGLNSSGWTPKGLSIEYLKSHNVDHINPIGVETIDIPGAVAGGMPCAAVSAGCPSLRSSHPRFTTRRMDFRWLREMRAIGSRRV